MAQTPVSSSVPYCTVARLFVYHDWQQVADMMRDGDNPRPTKLGLMDSTSLEGGILYEILKAASGEIDAACLVGGRYAVADLQALTGTGESYREKLTAHLSFWQSCQRRQPNAADPNRIPGAVTALLELERLRTGVSIFALQETIDAGNPEVIQPQPKPPDQTRVTGRAVRLFGNHGSH